MKGPIVAILVLIAALSAADAKLSEKALDNIITTSLAPGNSPELTLRLIARNLPKLDHRIPEESATIGILETVRAHILLRRGTGDRTDNLRQAASSLDNALQNLNIEDYPEQWLDAKFALADAHSSLAERTMSPRDEQLAIQSLNDVITEKVKASFKEKWKEAQIQLAFIYTYASPNLLPGDKIERAISLLQSVIATSNPQDDPEIWVDAQLRLADVYEPLIASLRPG
jgi:hypothetical protein